MTLRTLIAATVTAAASSVAAQSFDPAAVAADLASGETARVENARDATVAYLGNAGLSVSDRLSAVGELEGPVAEATGNEDEFVVVNALLIAGQFVTPSGFQLLGDHIDDDQPGLRYAAYRALRSSFEILSDQTAPSLQPAAARTAFARLAEAARAESDANTLEAAYRALAELLTVTAGPLKPLEAEAGATLGAIADERINGMGDLTGDDYALTLGASLYVALEYRKLFSTAGRRIDDATARAGAQLAGELISHAYAEFEKAGSIDAIDPDRRELLRQAISAAESVAYLALGRLGAQPAQSTLAETFAQGNDRDFRSGAFRLIGPAGAIQQAGLTLENAPSGG